MVDLTLTPFPGQTLPKDVYVALRIGESQKLGRISSERLYRFPRDAVGDHKYGKVEFLKKVSGLTVGVNPDTDAQQDITVPFENEMLKFKVHAKAPKDGSPKAQQAKDMSKMGKENRPKVKAARKYLDDHNLELRLKDAMQEVIRVMPADPAAFIGRWLASNANAVTKPFAPGPRVGDEEQPEAKAPPPPMPPKAAPDAVPVAQFPPPPMPPKATPDAAPEAEDLRLRAKSILVSGTKDGRLDAELQKLNKSAPPVPERSPAPDTEELRMQAKASLLGAISTGRLDEALASVKVAKSVPDNEEPTSIGGASRGKQPALPSMGWAAARLPAKGSALATVRRSKTAQFDPEDLRLQAKATLLEATASGRLSDTLANMKEVISAPDPEELRQQAKKTLLDATSTGRLDKALAEVKQGKNESDPEALRKMAKQTLLDATNSGRLDDVLSNVKQASVAKREPDVNQLREQAKEVLLQGISTGKLEEAMKLVQVPSDFAAEQLRTKAKDVLIASTKDGSLESVLGSCLKTSAPDTESLRQQAKKTLLEATSTGRLDSVLADVKRNQPTQDAMEDLRKQAAKSLLRSVESGALQNVLQKIQPVGGDVDVGSLRQQAKSLLLGAACDGRLDSALSSAIRPTDGNTEDLRLQAKKILEDSVKTGKLDSVLGSLGDKPVESDDEKLRKEVRSTLLEASFGGQLETTLAQLKGASTDASVPADAKSLDELRLQARDTLMSASKAGTLDAVLGKLRKPSDPEGLRLQVKGVLLKASENGSLDNTLAAIKAGDDAPPAADVEKLRTQAKATLLDAMSTGKLEQAMSDLKPSSDVETLRQDVKKVLLGAAGDGRLEGKLKELKPGVQPSADESVQQDETVQEVREKTQRALIAASQDGSLDDALAAADVTMAPITPVADRSQISMTASSPGELSMELLQTQLADGLRETITDTVKGAVGNVMKSAVDELKNELAKQDVQQAALADQMNELKQQVTELQTLSRCSCGRAWFPGEKYCPNCANPREPTRSASKVFSAVDRNNDGLIDLKEFKSAMASGTLGGSS